MPFRFLIFILENIVNFCMWYFLMENIHIPEVGGGSVRSFCCTFESAYTSMLYMQDYTRGSLDLWIFG